MAEEISDSLHTISSRSSVDKTKDTSNSLTASEEFLSTNRLTCSEESPVTYKQLTHDNGSSGESYKGVQDVSTFSSNSAERLSDFDLLTKEELIASLDECRTELDITKKKLDKTERQLQKANDYNSQLRNMVNDLLLNNSRQCMQ